MIYALLFSFIGTILGTSLGAFFGHFFKKFPREIKSFLINFSLGAMLALTFIELFNESLEHLHEVEDNYTLSTLYTTLIIFGVGIFFFILHELLHHLTHHHHEDNLDEESCKDHAHSAEVFEEKSLGLASLVFFIAITIHNIPEGLALGFSFINEGSSLPINGLITALILFLHNIIIGLSLYSSFKSHNKKDSFSLSMTILSSLPAFVFALIGYFISSISLDPLFVGIIYSISTGSLIYVLFIELIPIGLKDYKSKYSFIYILLGLLIFVILLSLGGHTH